MLQLLAHSLSGKLLTGFIAIWMKDNAVLSLSSSLAVEALQGRAKSYLEKRRANRLLEQIEDEILESLATFLDAEFREVKSGDKVLVVEKALELICTIDFYNACFEEAFDPKRILNEFDEFIEGAQRSLLISDIHAVRSIFSFAVTKYLSIISELPTFSDDALRTLLVDTDEILERIRNIEIEIKSARANDRAQMEEDEKHYRRLISRKLKKISIFGLDSKGLPKKYSLSIAYVNLTLTSQEQVNDSNQKSVLRNAFSAQSRLVVIRGEPGSGKTTLLSWLALNCAEMSLPNELSSIERKIPVFIQIREYANRELPKGSALLEEQFGVASGSFSEAWLKKIVKEGEIVFFLDGFDEVNEGRRQEVITWVNQLLDLFPNSTAVLSTRPYTGEELEELLLERCTLDSQILVQPMSSEQVTGFIANWYLSFSEEAESVDQKSRFEISRDRLLERLNHNSTLRSLIRNPLICSLICFVNADRDGFVPDQRGDLYRLATETLLDRRERERGIEGPLGVALSIGQKFKILGYISEYFYKRHRTQLEREDVILCLSEYLPSLAIKADQASNILTYLCERSHILRSPSVGYVDFSHKTFLEYFYARRLAEQGMFEEVTDEFFSKEFREVVLFTFSVGSSQFIEEVLISVIHTIKCMMKNGEDASSDVLVLQTSIQQAPEVKPHLRAEAIKLLDIVLPPRSIEQAIELASGGDVILEPLKDFAQLAHRENWRFVIDAALNTFSDDAVYTLLPFAKLRDPKVDEQLVNGRKYFESDTYRKVVISECKTIRKLEIRDWSDLDLLGSLPLLEKVVIKNFDDHWDDANVPVVPTITSLAIANADVIEDLSILSKFPNLRQLSVIDCSRIFDFSGISECIKLEEITLYSFELQSLNVMRNLKALRQLDVGDCTDLKDVQGIRELARLESLQLPYSYLYDGLPQSFQDGSIEISDDFLDADFDSTSLDDLL